ncbi:MULTISPECIES: MFS transporter [Cryobacterium]|uniref:MFS transporter n=1 Tax=Cryobacterium breve TaxID=1259258 RepID=A0ABY2IWB8_9MICO|nr:MULTISPECIES: MFS transporter [Cryobacterium]TFC93112.1 MFS transporter [Cryobacterium sp. TmT3-12]TFC96097.1 MFS transporter [Cryobacterium breve]
MSTNPDAPAPATPEAGTVNTSADHTPLQRTVVRVLIAGQILGGIGMGATLSLGALLAAQLSGSSAWSGMAATMSTLGAALVAVPLARLAQRRGRSRSLATGSLIAGSGAVLAITAVAVDVFPLLLLALMLLGAGSATNLQARFAATDLASTKYRARDLSIVVWSTTIGAVLGPNLFGPGEVVGGALGLPPLTGAFAFSLIATVGAAVVYTVGLRPDPLLTALAAREVDPSGGTRRGGLAIVRANPQARYAVAVIAFSHATMVALMSMAPVHLRDHGATLTVVGLTISLHVAGMYALSPVFGWLADRLGRLPVILVGQILLLAALAIFWLAGESQTAMTVGLILLGLGWSASVVAGSALIAEAVDVHDRAALQGFSDLSMNAAGALGGALAGLVLSAVGYSGLGLVTMVLVIAIVVWSAVRSATARPVLR